VDRGTFISLGQGALTTLWLSTAGIVIGVPLGLLIALLRVWRVPILAPIAAAYVSVVRATPLVTLALFIYFGLPDLGIELDPKLAALVALTLNTAPFHSEIWRASIVDIPREQIDAARAFGMTRMLTFRRIVLRQAWRASLPGMVNEMTFLIKGSPAIAVIGVVDLTRSAARVAAYTYDPIPPFMEAAVIYAIIVAVLVWAQRAIERVVVQKYGNL
jgi:His/Glu/Gln/Arg/opine family amino acid ABC transporter permease subunit